MAQRKEMEVYEEEDETVLIKPQLHLKPGKSKNKADPKQRRRERMYEYGQMCRLDIQTFNDHES